MPTFIRTLGACYDHGHDIGDHDHGWGQLIYASSGAIQVMAAERAWLIPSARALWLPPRTPHRLRMRGLTRLRTLYLPPAHCDTLAPTPLGLIVSPLLRELITKLVRIGHIDDADPFHRTLGEALILMLTRAERLHLTLTLPRDRRAVRVAEAILADPGKAESLDDMAAECGASLRTIQRKFLEETGMPLSDWRQTARLMTAAAVLMDGKTVTDAALEAGYASVSAFIHAFRGKVGLTPSSFRKTGQTVLF